MSRLHHYFPANANGLKGTPPPVLQETMLDTNNKMLNTNTTIKQTMSEVREPWRDAPCRAAPVAREAA